MSEKFRIGEFIDDACKLIGKEAVDVKHGFTVADWVNIRRFVGAIGDNNLLWIDPAYGATTYHYTMIAPPTFVAAMRVPASSGPLESKVYGEAVGLLESADFTWFDVVPLASRLSSRLKLTDVCEKTMGYDGLKPRQVVSLKSSAKYFKGSGDLVAVGSGVQDVIPMNRGVEWLLEREIYTYSDQEIKKIEKELDAVIKRGKRGNKPRYWSEVQIGEELPFLVKGPVTLADQMAWIVAEGRPMGYGVLTYRDLVKNRLGARRVNPSTGWPYFDSDQEFEDILSCRDLGYKYSNPTRGITRVALAGQLLTDWMGDEGFLRELSVSLPASWLYGDTMWMSGMVIQKYQETIGGEIYNAVRVQITGTNQLKETVLVGDAVAYLPEPGKPVSLPIARPKQHRHGWREP